MYLLINFKYEKANYTVWVYFNYECSMCAANAKNTQ